MASVSQASLSVNYTDGSNQTTTIGFTDPPTMTVGYSDKSNQTLSLPALIGTDSETDWNKSIWLPQKPVPSKTINFTDNTGHPFTLNSYLHQWTKCTYNVYGLGFDWIKVLGVAANVNLTLKRSTTDWGSSWYSWTINGNIDYPPNNTRYHSNWALATKLDGTTQSGLSTMNKVIWSSANTVVGMDWINAPVKTVMILYIDPSATPPKVS